MLVTIVSFPSYITSSQPKQILDIKDFLQKARRYYLHIYQIIGVCSIDLNE